MNPELLLQQLEELAEKLDIAISYSSMESDGGLCRIKNRRMILVNTRLSTPERIEVIAAALPREELEGVFVPPSVREVIERRRR